MRRGHARVVVAVAVAVGVAVAVAVDEPPAPPNKLARILWHGCRLAVMVVVVVGLGLGVEGGTG